MNFKKCWAVPLAGRNVVSICDGMTIATDGGAISVVTNSLATTIVRHEQMHWLAWIHIPITGTCVCKMASKIRHLKSMTTLSTKASKEECQRGTHFENNSQARVPPKEELTVRCIEG